MAGAWTTLNVKDGGGTTRTMRVWDESGTGVGPYSFGQVLADGLGGAVTVTGGALSVTSAGASSAGDVAHDSADSGNPVKIGYKATSSLAGLTLVANADRTNAFAGLDGVPIMRPHCNLEDIVTNVVTCTAGANTSGISAQGSGIKFYLTDILISNTGASNGRLIVTDGSGGTTKTNLPFAASLGTVKSFNVPVPFSANTAVYVDPTGSDDIIVTLIGFKSKV